MIVSVLTGRKGSKGFPSKNLHKVFGKPLAYYPMMAAMNCLRVDKEYLSTNDKQLMKLARKYNTEVIERPEKLCTDEAFSEDVFVHAYEEIKKRNPDQKIEILVLLMCNAIAITPDMISTAIEVLENRPEYDSAVTVSRYNMWSPYRARKIGDDGLLYPYVSLDLWDNSNKVDSHRDSQDDVWFADMGASIVKARCLDNIEEGVPPQKWMGKKIYPITQEGGLDVDYEWQIPQLREWLKEYIKKDEK